MAFDKANAEVTPSLPPDMSSPSSSFANLSFITLMSETHNNQYTDDARNLTY